MTRADFYDWLISQGCSIEPMPEDARGNTIIIRSPRANSKVYYNTPIDNRPVKCYSVCTICDQLYVPIPDECKHVEGLANFIKDKHFPKR